MSDKRIRLTAAQWRELASAPSSCIAGFAPVAKLKDLGLVTANFANNGRWHYDATPAGAAWLAAQVRHD